MERTIEIVLDVEKGEIYHSDEFFQKSEHELIRWRRALEESILLGKPKLVCPYCRQMLKLCGRYHNRGVVSYFSHLYDSEDCEIKTTTALSKEEIEARKYGAVSESERHIELKHAIADALSDYNSRRIGVTSVEIETRITSPLPYMNWRRPDVQAAYNGKKLVFELQLSTTFLSVVADRDLFYRLNGYYIIWVFNFERNEEYVNLHNMMCKDIYYANKRNIFIFDHQAQKLSVERGELILCCCWLDADGKFSSSEYLSLDQLSFDEDTMKPYYVDADKLYYEKYPHVEAELKQLERTREDILRDLMLRQQHEKDLLLEEYRRLKEIKKEIYVNSEVADIYENDGKIGFIYKNQPLSPPLYSDIEWDQEYQQFKITKRKRNGLADRAGEVVVPCICSRIERLEPGLYLIVEKRQWKVFGSKSPLKNESVTDRYAFRRIEYGYGVLNFEYKERGYSYLSQKCFLIFPDRQTVEVNAINLEDKIVKVKAGRFQLNPDGYLYQDSTDKVRLYLGSNGKLGLFKDSSRVIPAEYDEISYSSDYCIYVIRGSFHGILTIDNQVIVPVEFSDISTVSDNLYLVKKWSGYGIYDHTGNIMVPAEFDKIEVLEEYYLCIREHLRTSYYVLYSKEGQRMISIDEKMTSFTKRDDGFIEVKNEDRKITWLKPDLSKLLPWSSEVTEIGIFNNGVAECRLGRRYAKIDIDGNIYDIVENLPETIMMTFKDERYGLANCRGQELIPCIYRSLLKMPNGMYLGDSRDLISDDARLVKTFRGEFFSLNDNMFVHKDTHSSDNKYSLYDASMRLIRNDVSFVREMGDCIYVESTHYRGRFFNQYQVTLCGILDMHGNTIVPVIYDEIEFPYPDIALCREKYGAIAVNLVTHNSIETQSIQMIAEIDNERYYCLQYHDEKILADSSLAKLGKYASLSFNAQAGIIEGISKGGTAYNALTFEVLVEYQSLEIGGEYVAFVTGIQPYGVFVKIAGNHVGMIHKSVLAQYSKRCHDYKIGQRLVVKVINIKDNGKVDLDIKVNE